MGKENLPAGHNAESGVPCFKIFYTSKKDMGSVFESMLYNKVFKVIEAKDSESAMKVFADICPDCVPHRVIPGTARDVIEDRIRTMGNLTSLFRNAQDNRRDGSCRLVAATVNKGAGDIMETGDIERVTWSEILPSDIADKLVKFLLAEIAEAYAKINEQGG